MQFQKHEDGTYTITMNEAELANHQRVMAVQYDRFLQNEGVPPEAIRQAYELYGVVDALTGINGAPQTGATAVPR